MHQQRGDMDARIEDLWRDSGEPGDLDDFITQFYRFQTCNHLTFQKCLEDFRFKRRHNSSSDDSDDDDEEPTDSFVNGPLSIDTLDVLLLTVHNCLAGTSNTNIQTLWQIVLDAEDLDSEDDDDEEEPPTYEVSRFKDFILNYDQLEVYRSLFASCRRGTIKLTKITLANLMGNMEDAYQ